VDSDRPPLKSLYEGSVGLQNVFAEQPRGRHPFELLPIQPPRLTCVAVHYPHRQFDVAVGVFVGEAHQGVAGDDRHAEFFT
jgi:hypothetical protein